MNNQETKNKQELKIIINALAKQMVNTTTFKEYKYCKRLIAEFEKHLKALKKKITHCPVCKIKLETVSCEVDGIYDKWEEHPNNSKCAKRNFQFNLRLVKYG